MVVKVVSNFIYGFVFGLAIYEFMISKLKLPWPADLITLISLCLTPAFFCIFSTKIRSVSLLTLPATLGKEGRGVLKGLIVGYLLMGPVNNIILNGNEVIRIFTCSSTLGAKLQIVKYKLMYEPIEKALKNMHVDLSDVNQIFSDIDNIITPLRKEIEDRHYDSLSRNRNSIDEKYAFLPNDTDADIYEKLYLSKMEHRCTDLIENVTEKCENLFDDVLETCYATLPSSGAFLMCAVIEMDDFCNAENLFDSPNPCDAKNNMKNGIGSHMETLMLSTQFFKDDFKPVETKINVKQPDFDMPDNVKGLTQKLLEIINQKRNTFLNVINVLNTLLGFLYLRVIWTAINYTRRYLYDITFDNLYITNYYKKIDERRSQKGISNLIPLKKIEKIDLVDSNNWKMNMFEINKIFNQLIVLIFEIIIASLFVIIDILFQEALITVKNHADIEYTQTGSHNFTLEVKGTGMVAKLVKSMMSNFNITETVNIHLNNTECMPQPSSTDDLFYYKIYGGYALIFLSLIFNLYISKFNRLICSSLFPKREKTRILFLYNECLKKRKLILKTINSHIKTSRDEDNSEKEYDVLRRLPLCGNFFNKSKCAICRDIIKSTLNLTCFQCKTSYCSQCWEDFLKICPFCSNKNSGN